MKVGRRAGHAPQLYDTGEVAKLAKVHRLFPVS
jgi:hypothetical protein